VYLDNLAGVQFTLYELKQELKSRGHDIDLPRLNEASPQQAAGYHKEGHCL
jgi:hypothetical protein